MPRRYKLTVSIEDEIEAEDLDEAWDTFKTRFEDRFYGPTIKDIEDMGEILEEEE